MSGDDDDETGFSFEIEDELPAEASAPAEYRSAVVAAAVAHIGGGMNALPCICARCPAALWTIGDIPGETVTPAGEIARASEEAAWTLAVFCRAQHKDLTSFEANYRKGRYMVRSGLAIGFCDAYDGELEAWQARAEG